MVKLCFFLHFIGTCDPDQHSEYGSESKQTQRNADPTRSGSTSLIYREWNGNVRKWQIERGRGRGKREKFQEYLGDENIDGFRF